MRELVEYLTRALVDDPDAVEVEEFPENDGSVTYEISVADDDYGKVIGRGGRTAQALRTVIKAAAAGSGDPDEPNRRRVFIDIVE